MKCDVLCAGAMVMDLLAGPLKTEDILKGHAQAEAFRLQSGGDALNQSIILSRLGKNACLVSQTGADVFGNALVDECRRNGVDTSCVIQLDSGAVNVAVVLVDESGERRFVGNKANDFKKMTAANFDFNKLPEAGIFSFASLFLFPFITARDLALIFGEAKKRGMMTSLDVKMPKNGEKIDDIAPVLGYVDYIFPNDEEAYALTGKTDLRDMAGEFLSRGVKNVVIKTGGNGCYFRNSAEEFISPAMPDVNCIDSTGAGDSFIAAFLSAKLEGRNDRECCAFANAAASLTVEQVGAISGVRDRAAVDERYGTICKLAGF